MKAITRSIFFGLLLLSSCTNEKEESQVESEIVGKWTLQSISGGFAGTGYEAFFTHVAFKSDASYVMYNQERIVSTGVYTIENQIEGAIIDFTVANPNAFESSEKTIRFENEQLSLEDPCCDLYLYTFGPDSE